MSLPAPLLDGRAPISGYGRGSFRIGGLSHPGSLLILPDAVHAWPVADPLTLTPADLSAVTGFDPAPGFLILGTGPTQLFPDAELRAAFAEAGIGLEAMDTGAACRTHNILLAEERIFATALIAVN